MAPPDTEIPRRGRGHHAPDGSALQVYLHLPPGPTAEIVDAALGGPSRILELGSGPGRITRRLVELGHSLTAVDESSQMLAHVTGAETVCADASTLRLQRRFDAVLLASHLVNDPDPKRRLGLLRTSSRHLDEGGCLIIERFAPDWAPVDGPLGQRGDFGVSIEDVQRSGKTVSFTMAYRRGDELWTHAVTALILDDADLADELARAGLRLERTLTPDRRWVVAVSSKE
jgi:SAM-dependent methyltransferase